MNKILIKERINGSYAVSYEMAQKCLPEIKEMLNKSNQVILGLKQDRLLLFMAKKGCLLKKVKIDKKKI